MKGKRCCPGFALQKCGLNIMYYIMKHHLISQILLSVRSLEYTPIRHKKHIYQWFVLWTNMFSIMIWTTRSIWYAFDKPRIILSITYHLSGQIIATSHDLTPNGWWNIMIWPDLCTGQASSVRPISLHRLLRMVWVLGRLRWASAHPNAPRDVWHIDLHLCKFYGKCRQNISVFIRSIYGIFHGLAFDLVDVDKKMTKNHQLEEVVRIKDSSFRGWENLENHPILGYVVTLEVKPTIKILFPWNFWLQTLTKTIVLTEKPFKT